MEDHRRTPNVAVKDSLISDEEFHLLQEEIYRLCGIYFHRGRKLSLERRVAGYMRQENLETVRDLLGRLRAPGENAAEMRRFFDAVTVNETFFFREASQFKALTKLSIPDLLRRRPRRVALWSAGCSSGEEPYTIAIAIEEDGALDGAGIPLGITGTDISEETLNVARAAIYEPFSLRGVPQEIRERYFREQDGRYRLLERTTRRVEFRFLNLADPEGMEGMREMDVIFCRNVLIYFDRPFKERVLRCLHDSLNPGGVLFVGRAESLFGLNHPFLLQHYPGGILYRKEG